MAKLPSLTARKVVVRTLKLTKAGRTVKEPLLRDILRDANLSVEDFINLL